MLFSCLWLAGQIFAADPWELPPLRYSEQEAQDPIATLAKRLADDPHAIPAGHPLERLRFVLKTLQIDEESQILVFSKTSKQNDLITPITPRALYFSENAYVGYVPGGDIEVISHDPILGPVFYVIGNRPGAQQPTITRENGECFSCHATARTENVPGVLVRSVYPDHKGLPQLEHGSFLTTHSSPIPERWGGYYVTGRSSLPHLGNRTFGKDFDPLKPGPTPQWKTLDGQINTKRYLRPTSDIVALMVLEHQCRVLNQLQAASQQFQRFLWLRRTINPRASAADATSREHLEHAARPIVDLLFFKDEAPLGEDGIEGDPAFQRAYTRRFPRCSDGRSLADFQLYKRLFKYPCSPMVHSECFRHLPAPLRETIIRRMHRILTTLPAPDNQPQVPASARPKILHILEETLEGWPEA